MYLIFRDMMNHALLYSVDAPSEHDALHEFVLWEMPSVLFNPGNHSYLVPDGSPDVPDIWYGSLNALIDNEFASRDIRFEIRKMPSPEGRGVVDLFCSNDQIHQIPESRMSRYQARKHEQLGFLYVSLGRHHEAVQEFRGALVNEPDDATTLTHLADALVKCGESPEAIRIYEQLLLRASPSNEIEWCLEIGRIHRSLGDHANAALHLTRCLDLVEDEDERFRQSNLDDASEDEDEDDERESQDRAEIRCYLSDVRHLEK